MAHQASGSAGFAGWPWLAVTGDVVVQRPAHGCDERLRTLLTESTVAVGNLEVPLTTRGQRAEKAATHRADPKLATELRDLGFDAVTLANNHMLDFGGAGLGDTVAALDGVGAGHCGAGTTDAAAREPLYLTTPAGVVALVGLCAALPPGFAAGPARPTAIRPSPTEKHARAILRRLVQPVAGPPDAGGTVPVIEVRRDDRTGMTIGEVALERDR